jgi:hypothetical protein
LRPAEATVPAKFSPVAPTPLAEKKLAPFHSNADCIVPSYPRYHYHHHHHHIIIVIIIIISSSYHHHHQKLHRQ